MAWTVDEFANRIKLKYPDYQDMDNQELTNKMLAKYPQYKADVITTPQESFIQKLGKFAAPKIQAAGENLDKVDTAIIRSPTFGPVYSGLKESAKTVLSGLVTEEQAGRFAESAGRRFPESKTAQIGAAALGTVGQMLSIADLALPVVNKLRLLVKAPQATKAVELAKLQSTTKPEIFNAAIKEAGIDPYTISQIQKDIRGTSTYTAPGQIRPLEQGAIPTPPTPAPFKGRTGLPTQKPFTMQAGLAEKDKSALEAFKAQLPRNAGEAIPPMSKEMAAFRAKLPKGPEIGPQTAQAGVQAAKPALVPTTPAITPKAPVTAVAGTVEEVPPFKARLLEGLKGAEISRKKQELLNAMERSKRTAKLAGVKETGYQGFKAKMGALKGQFEKAEFESISKNFTQNELDQMFDHLNKTNKLVGEWERLNAQTALEKLIGAKGAGQIPTNSELSLLSRVYGDDLVKELAAKQGTMEKLWTGTKDVLNLPRALMSTADLSMPLRQGVVLGAGNPKRFTQAFKEMFKYAWDEKAYVGLIDDIRKRPTYDLMRKNGLDITELGKLGSKEEQFASNIAESIPVLGRAVRASNRAASGFLNKLRADVFDDLVKAAKEEGALTDETVTKNIARFINIGTGRGEVLDSLKGATEALNATFFSPKLMASRMQMLNPKTYAQLDPFTRKQALKSMRNFLGAGMTVLGIAKAAGADVGVDPRSADFGKIKIGNTRYDIWGGFQQYMVLASRLASGEMVSSTTGKEFKLGEGYKSTTRADIAQRFVESKTAPIASFAIGALKGKTTMGDDFDIPAEVIDRVIPMMAQDYYDLTREYGPGKAAVMVAPGVFGAGSQTYSEAIPTKVKGPLGKETVKFKNAPSIGGVISSAVRGEKQSNISPEEQQRLIAKRKQETLDKIEVDKAKAIALETGEPQRVGNIQVYLDRGVVRTKNLSEIPQNKAFKNKEAFTKGISDEMSMLGIDANINSGQANVISLIMKDPRYKLQSLTARREIINRFLLSKQK